MAVWIIGDPHLSFSVDKPMDIFGEAWKKHWERLQENWARDVAEDDTVIIAGDISWGMRPEDAIADLEFIHKLPGKRKILLRGNHDYWWTTRKRVENLFLENGLHSLEIFQNEATCLDSSEGRILMVGSRGWSCPGDEDFSKEDEKVYKREVQRLQISLADAKKKMQKEDFVSVLGVMHYPPVNRMGLGSDFSELLEGFPVDICCYGHLHGHAAWHGFEGERNSVRYVKVSADFLSFQPKKIFV